MLIAKKGGVSYHGLIDHSSVSNLGNHQKQAGVTVSVDIGKNTTNTSINQHLLKIN